MRHARTRLLLVLLCLSLLRPAGDARAAADPGTALRVATWNLKWFGHPKYPRTSAQLGEMASEVASWGVHVLAFQEAAVTRLGPSGQPRSYAMDELVAILSDDYGQTWEYWIHKGKGEQHLGWMWRSDQVELVASPVYGLKSKAADNVLTTKKGKKKHVKKNPWPRIPVVAHVRAGEGLTDFTLVNVHLKAAELQYGKDSYWETRRAASESLARWIEKVWNPPPPKPKKKPGKKKKPKHVKKALAPAAQKLYGTAFPLLSPFPQTPVALMGSVLSHLDPDLAVLGDFNAPAHADLDAEPLIGLGMHFLGGEDPTHKGGASLDRILVSLPMGEEHALSMGSAPAGQAFAISPGSKGGSDHRMVSFTVAVRADDD
jgi:endonuclease/exonuclease/phosphatase family metal-dependent hydrolase